ncbi:hypothetical protein L2E82_26479 [Cichorium intybus]|uniref:Uncharacterized protein n=1 Tax=Cichorium intybus TaxID=13427 RepID=A0ACB9CQU1_CICIN|nr:hypothetical protein L2E82_26479 [Cichorium intybus]
MASHRLLSSSATTLLILPHSNVIAAIDIVFDFEISSSMESVGVQNRAGLVLMSHVADVSMDPDGDRELQVHVSRPYCYRIRSINFPTASMKLIGNCFVFLPQLKNN